MICLLDVSALIGLGFAQHEFHERVATWVAAQEDLSLATCSITELGFVRILPQMTASDLSVAEARALLHRLKKSQSFRFFADDHDISHLPAWVKMPRQTSDGHLVRLARAHGATLATLDHRIPGAYLIPNV